MNPEQRRALTGAVALFVVSGGLDRPGWWYGWRLLRGRPDPGLDRLCDGHPEPVK